MKILTIIGAILVIIGLVLIVPFIFIWALNGLFSLSIAYTWTNWFYALVLMFFLKGTTSTSKSK